MSLKSVVAPRLPNAPDEYDAGVFNNLINVLRLYFNQLGSAGPMSAASQFNGAAIIAGLSFPPNPGSSTPSLPTQADLAALRVGDIYYDTSAGNVLKVKT
jgi:hypothetical protein